MSKLYSIGLFCPQSRGEGQVPDSMQYQLHVHGWIQKLQIYIYSIGLFCVQRRGLALQVEQEVQRRNLMQGDIKSTSMDLNKAKSKEKQLAKEISDMKQEKRNMEEEVRKLKE